MGIGPEVRHFISVRKVGGEDLLVCALYLEDIIPYTVDVRGPGLDKAVRQSLYIPYLVPFNFSFFLFVSGNLPLGQDPCESCQDGFCVPRRALTIQLIAGENNGVRSLGIEGGSQGEVVPHMGSQRCCGEHLGRQGGCKSVTWRVRGLPSMEKWRGVARGGPIGGYLVFHRRGFG